MLLTLQTPVAAVVEASTDGGIQQEMTVENQKGQKRIEMSLKYRAKKNRVKNNLIWKYKRMI